MPFVMMIVDASVDAYIDFEVDQSPESAALPLRGRDLESSILEGEMSCLVLPASSVVGDEFGSTFAIN